MDSTIRFPHALPSWEFLGLKPFFPAAPGGSNCRFFDGNDKYGLDGHDCESEAGTTKNQANFSETCGEDVSNLMISRRLN